MKYIPRRVGLFAESLRQPSLAYRCGTPRSGFLVFRQKSSPLRGKYFVSRVYQVKQLPDVETAMLQAKMNLRKRKKKIRISCEAS